MLNEIKSTLKNKSNLIYIIIVIILFIILNISLNLKTFIDSYYNYQVENYINEAIEMYSINYDELVNSFKTLQLSDSTNTSVEDLKEILNGKKQVKNIRTKEVNYGTSSANYIYIELNDWKDCIDIKQYLDNRGIDTYYQAEETFYENYKNVRSYSNIIKYFSIIIAVLIFIVVCNNVIKNEIKDIKNLVNFGYTKRKIKSIIFIKLFSITFIGFFLGIIISQLFLYLIADILKIKIYRNIIREIIINLIIIIIPIFIIKTRTLNKKFFK